MKSWLDRPGSLNWANRDKLTSQITELEESITSIKNTLLLLSSVANHWSTQSKDFLELGGKDELTANHILHLKPLLERIRTIRTKLDSLHSLYIDDLTELYESNPPHHIP